MLLQNRERTYFGWSQWNDMVVPTTKECQFYHLLIYHCENTNEMDSAERIGKQAKENSENDAVVTQ